MVFPLAFIELYIYIYLQCGISVNFDCHHRPWPVITRVASQVLVGKVLWREDHRCGYRFPLQDGHTPAQCNPESEDSCCSEFGWCGKTKDHCNCKTCIDYRTAKMGKLSFHFYRKQDQKSKILKWMTWGLLQALRYRTRFPFKSGSRQSFNIGSSGQMNTTILSIF